MRFNTKKEKSYFNKVLTFIEKQAVSNILLFYAAENENEYIYISNEYSILKLDIEYYDSIFKKNPFNISSLDLETVAQNNKGYSWDKRKKQFHYFDISHFIKLFETYSNTKTVYNTAVDTMLTKTAPDENTLPVHIFATNNTLVTINSRLYDLIIELYNNMGSYIEIYGTAATAPIIFNGAGVEFYILPVRTFSNNLTPLQRAVYNEYRPELLTAAPAAI